jgi:hypothetical protein
MEKTAMQVEKNVSASFAYVKKDMLMLNDAFSDLHEKVQHLSLNHAMLLEQITRLREELIENKLITRLKGKTIKKRPIKKVVKKKK